MRRWAILRGKEENLVKDLKETILSFKTLGQRYGVSKQAIYEFSKRQGIERPAKPEGHQIEECRLCQKLIQISKRPHSEFISIHTIVEKIGVSKGKYFYHLRRLRHGGLVNEKFGKLRSERTEKAYAMYFTKRLSIQAIGREVGYKSFYSIIQKHRALGWNVPPSLYVYDGRERSRILSQRHRRKKW